MQYINRHRLTIALLCCLSLSGPTANNCAAQPDSESVDLADNSSTANRPNPIPRARWSEDWSTFGDSSPLLYPEITSSSYFWAPIKNISFNENKDSYLSFGGELRLAYELYDEKDMGISDIGYQDALQLRLAMHADWHLSKRWRIFSQLGYGTASDREGGSKAGDNADINIWELFVGYRFPVEEDERVVFRLGRQLIEVANLFVNVGEGNNVRQHYDGLRVGWIDDEFVKFDSFVAEYVDFADESFEMSGTGEYFWGFSSGYRIKESGLNLNFSYFGWDLKDRQFEQGGGKMHDEERHTLMFWMNKPINVERQLYRPLGNIRQWSFDYYLAYQFGEYEDQPGGSHISAFAGFGETRYAVFQEANTPILGLKTAYFSGDSDPNDDELNTFYDHVFATPFFGYARDIQPYDLIFIQPNIGYRFGERDSLITLSHGFFWRADTNDAFYGKPNGITASAGTSDSSWVGQQLQLSVRYLINPNLLLTGYLARFFAGDMIEDAGGSDRDYFHIALHYLF